MARENLDKFLSLDFPALSSPASRFPENPGHDRAQKGSITLEVLSGLPHEFGAAGQPESHEVDRT